jgi:hypothetical protein
MHGLVHFTQKECVLYRFSVYIVRFQRSLKEFRLVEYQNTDIYFFQ